MRNHPLLYQINAAVFLNRMRRKYGREMTLAGVPENEWGALKELGMDFIWLMGVWQRSPQARHKALACPNLRAAYTALAADWCEEDVGGSPYAVYGYRLDGGLGNGNEDLLTLRRILNRLGLKLMLDFVPNHLAMDHPWTLECPEYFIRPKPHDLEQHLSWFFETPAGVRLAHGRDPHFEPWNDTVQVNIFAQATRDALTRELLNVANLCDGVRCDMAMLLLNSVFKKTWHGFFEAELPQEFWPGAIQTVKEKHPRFVLMAEVYWDLERTLQQMGFDFTYDKRVYDWLRDGNVESLKEYLSREDAQYQRRSVHFIENHDEERAALLFGKKRSLAAAAVVATLPGLRFFHDGQLEGKRTRIPVQFQREPVEEEDKEMREFYGRLLAAADLKQLHSGSWRLIREEKSNISQAILSWAWITGEGWVRILINYSSVNEEIHILPPAQAHGKYDVKDFLSGRTVLRSEEIEAGYDKGTAVKLEPWECLILTPSSRR